MRKKKAKPVEKMEEVKREEEKVSLVKIAEFRYGYEENAKRVAFAHAMSFHYVKIRQENSAFIVEIYGRG
jgi:hypothetical protein